MQQLAIEGHVTFGAAEELLASGVAGLHNGQNLLLNLSGVSYADAAGVDAIRQLADRGAVVVGCSGFLSELLRDGHAAAAQPTAPTTSTDDPDLLVRLRAGDDAAFETLVRLYGGRLLATARRMLGNDDDARDAVQEAFLSAFKSINGFAGDARLSTWLHRIVVNAALMKMRSRRRRPEDSIDDLLPRFDDEGQWATDATRHSTSVDTLLSTQETRRRVRACIEQLPESYRTVLMLRDIEDLDTEEAATALGITPNAVKIRLHRARQALRTLLEREFVVG